MATALRVSFCFFFDAHSWCQVSRTLLQYFQRYCLFSIFHYLVANNMTSHLSNLHNRKKSISLEQKKIFQKENHHSSVFWKAFQINTNYFSLHRHFKPYISICLLVGLVWFAGIVVKCTAATLFLTVDWGSPIGFTGSGIWLISRPGFGMGRRFGTRDLAILAGGNWEMSL